MKITPPFNIEVTAEEVELIRDAGAIDAIDSQFYDTIDGFLSTAAENVRQDGEEQYIIIKIRK
jgi:hypothetical protein